jgi:hypothetical protein
MSIASISLHRFDGVDRPVSWLPAWLGSGVCSVMVGSFYFTVAPGEGPGARLIGLFTGPLLSILILAAVLVGLSRFLNLEVRGRNILAAVAKAALVYYMLYALIGAAVIASSAQPASLDPLNLSPTNLAFFLDRPNPYPSYLRVLMVFDALRALYVYLIAVGLAPMVPRIPFRKLLTIVLVGWAVQIGAVLLIWILAAPHTVPTAGQ